MTVAPHLPGAFPRGFLWGAATSAYQVEGAVTADGRSESIWDVFCRRPGAIEDGSDGAVACDHYRRWPEDLALLRELGLNAYRFSVAWPRVIPGGTGAVNERGLDFYDKLVDGLVAAGIRPFLTLYHWDLPQVLQEAGGWLARGIVEAFEDYTRAVTRRLGDRVQDWLTINEPWCIATLGHAQRHHAPGLGDPVAGIRAAHHLLLAHGRAVQVVRSTVPGGRVGIVLNLTPGFPASDSAEDAQATARFDGEFNRWYLDPLYGKGYPADVVATHVARGHGPALEAVQPGDMAQIAAPTDFLGINYYSRAIIRADVPEHLNRPRLLPPAPPERCTDMGWEVYPDGLRELLLRVQRDFAPPRVLITESGAAFADGPDADGRVRDERRLQFLEGHLKACHQAIAAGVPLGGYFYWSLLDNFEWGHGHGKRFGLVHVDYPTQARVVKDSGRYLARVATTNTLLEVTP